MNRFEELMKSVACRPAVITHLGAGTCSEHELYKNLNSSQIIYVEPDKYLAEIAANTFRNTPHINVIRSAIASENGRRTLNITNNPRFSSLLLPGELLGFYPNIKVDEEAEVEAITLTKLCQIENIRKDLDNLLIAELQGMEKDVFSTADIDTLQKFKWIVIRSSLTNLYSNVIDRGQRSLAEVMQDAGFMVLTFEEDTPPFINILCLRNDAAIENSQLKTHQAELSGTIETLEKNLSGQLANLDELQNSLVLKSAQLDEFQTLIQSLTTKNDNLSSTIENKSAELEAAQALVQSLTDQNDHLSSTIESQSAELGTAQALVQSLTDQNEQLSNTIENQTAELGTAQALVQSLTDQNDHLSSTIESQSAELGTAQALVQSLTDQNDHLSSTIESQSAELGTAQALVQSLTDQSDRLSNAIGDKSAELERSQTLVQSLTDWNDKLSRIVESKSAELETAQTLVQSLTDQNDNQQKQIAELAESSKEKSKEFSDMQQTLRINSKLILKSDKDLKDLQLQYRAALQHQEQQHALLSELKNKLREASVFYQKLNLQKRVFTDDILESNNSENSDSDLDPDEDR